MCICQNEKNYLNKIIDETDIKNDKDLEIAQLKRIIKRNNLIIDEEKCVDLENERLLIDDNDVKNKAINPKKRIMASETLTKYIKNSSNRYSSTIRMGIPTLDPFVIDTHHSVASMIGGKKFNDLIFRWSKTYYMLIMLFAFFV